MRKYVFIGIGLIGLLISLILLAVYQIEQTPGLTFLAVTLTMIPFFISFEKENKKARDLMPIVVLSAMAVVGRMLLMPLPNFKPVTAIIILAGIAFGPDSGFMTGALSALVSNLFFGQGPWTPWQMLAWGLIGFVAGLLSEKNLLVKRWQILLYGVLASFSFGIFMDSWTILAYIRPLDVRTVLTSYSLGMAFNISHIVSTLIFLLPIESLWLPQLKRIKIKFSLK